MVNMNYALEQVQITIQSLDPGICKLIPYVHLEHRPESLCVKIILFQTVQKHQLNHCTQVYNRQSSISTCISLKMTQQTIRGKANLLLSVPAVTEPRDYNVEGGLAGIWSIAICRSTTRDGYLLGPLQLAPVVLETPPPVEVEALVVGGGVEAEREAVSATRHVWHTCTHVR